MASYRGSVIGSNATVRAVARPFRVVRAEGNPEQRGRAIGRAFREEIADRAAFYASYFGRWDLRRRDLEELSAPFIAAAEAALPDRLTMLRAMAEGAGVPFIDLFVPNAFEELEPIAMRRGSPRHAERCSAVTVVAPGVTLLGHNEMWLAADVEAFGIVIEVPSDGVATVSPTTVCYLPAVGMNASGGAQGVMSLDAEDDRVGVPRTLVARHALEASGRDDAVARTGVPDRSGGYAYACARAGGESFAIETTATRQAVLDGPGAHTNHYLDPELAAMNEEPTGGTLGRLRRLETLVAEQNPATPEELMNVLADHAGSPVALCIHPDPDDGVEAEAVVFSMVCDLEARRMWVAPETPCEGYQEVDLSDSW
jgi:isopenicillin-N N-acyltransferase-like protein